VQSYGKSGARTDCSAFESIPPEEKHTFGRVIPVIPMLKWMPIMEEIDTTWVSTNLTKPQYLQKWEET
jgi:hypothetical protein